MENFDHAYFSDAQWWDTTGQAFAVANGLQGALAYATDNGWKLQCVTEGQFFFVRKI